MYVIVCNVESTSCFLATFSFSLKVCLYQWKIILLFTSSQRKSQTSRMWRWCYIWSEIWIKSASLSHMSESPPHPLRFTFQFLSLTYFHLLIFFFCALLYKTEIFSKMNISFIRDAREASPPSAGGQKLTARLPPLLPITAEAMWLSLCWPHLLRHSSLLFTILLTRSTSYHCERDRAVQFPFKITSVTLQLKDKQRKHFQTAF